MHGMAKRCEQTGAKCIDAIVPHSVFPGAIRGHPAPLAAALFPWSRSRWQASQRPPSPAAQHSPPPAGPAQLERLQMYRHRPISPAPKSPAGRILLPPHPSSTKSPQSCWSCRSRSRSLRWPRTGEDARRDPAAPIPDRNYRTTASLAPRWPGGSSTQRLQTNGRHLARRHCAPSRQCATAVA